MFIIISHVSKLSYIRSTANAKVTTVENQDIDVVRIRMGTKVWVPYWQEPLISNVLLWHIAQIGKPEFGKGCRRDGNDYPEYQWLGEVVRNRSKQRLTRLSGARAQTHYGMLKRRCCPQSHRIRPAKCSFLQESLTKNVWQRSNRVDLQPLFTRIGTRYKHMRKRLMGVPLSQLYEYAELCVCGYVLLCHDKGIGVNRKKFAN